MFDRYVFVENSCKNIEKDNKTAGFELKTYINYYRGIPCSMIQDIQVKADGEEIPKDKILFSPDGIDFFTMEELPTVSGIRWEYDTPGIVRVMRDGGLSKGTHEVFLSVTLRIAYMPGPIIGERTRSVVIE